MKTIRLTQLSHIIKIQCNMRRFLAKKQRRLKSSSTIIKIYIYKDFIYTLKINT